MSKRLRRGARRQLSAPSEGTDDDKDVAPRVGPPEHWLARVRAGAPQLLEAMRVDPWPPGSRISPAVRPRPAPFGGSAFADPQAPGPTLPDPPASEEQQPTGSRPNPVWAHSLPCPARARAPEPRPADRPTQDIAGIPAAESASRTPPPPEPGSRENPRRAPTRENAPLENADTSGGPATPDDRAGTAATSASAALPIAEPHAVLPGAGETDTHGYPSAPHPPDPTVIAWVTAADVDVAAPHELPLDAVRRSPREQGDQELSRRDTSRRGVHPDPFAEPEFEPWPTLPNIDLWDDEDARTEREREAAALAEMCAEQEGEAWNG